jgi:pyruvate/2-oxoglutarate dehydrogenase complex dihydrolipoamide acyltransferase (E2) component
MSSPSSSQLRPTIPTFAYELAVIIQDGLKRMYEEQENVFYYITTMNENYAHPAMPEGARRAFSRACTAFARAKAKKGRRVQLLGCGTILREVIAAADLLRDDWGVVSPTSGAAPASTNWPATARTPSAGTAAPGGGAAQELGRASAWSGTEGPVIAATDYMRLFAEQIRPFVTPLPGAGHRRLRPRDTARSCAASSRWIVTTSPWPRSRRWPTRGGALPHASPGVRRFARELGADLNQIRGSGPKGRILKSDVKEFVKSRLSEPVTATLPSTGGAGIPAMPEVDFSKFGEIEALDTPRIKKLSGAHLHRAWLNIPHVTHHDEADITDLEAFRNQINDEQARAKSGIKVTLLAFAMKAVARALHEFPLLNSSLSPDGQKLIYKKYFHIGIAVDTPNGLVVPVFRDVDKKGVLDLATEMSEVSARARDGKLKPTEMQGGCMSISSLGGIGGTAFTPIVNAPEVAILGLTRARMTPVWNEQEFVPRLMLPVDLSYDHRVVDGAEAARFVAWLCKALGDPRRLLL